MIKKRGQVTTFIIIGLFLVLFIALLLYIRYAQEKTETEKQAEQITHFSASALKVKPYVTQCIERQAVIALILAAKNEGYFDEQNASLPPIEILEDTISEYVKDNIILCTHFAVFEEFNVTPGEPNISVHIYSTNVVIDLDWPLQLVQGDLVLYEREFRVVFPLKLNELYNKVKTVVEHNITLDLSHMLTQQLDIEIIGCEDDSIRYLVNDMDYLLDENVLRFFFRTGRENLSKLFEFENGIRYVPYAKPGRHTLRLAGENKTISFSVTQNNYVSGCFEEINESPYFTYSIVKQNSIPFSVSANEPAEIDIVEMGGEAENILLSSVYTVAVPQSVDAIITFNHNFSYLKPKIYIFESGWKEIESVEHGNYVSANVTITKLATYAVGTPLCAQLNQGDGLNIVFVPVDYENLSEFTLHAHNYTQTLLSVSPIDEFKEKFNIFHVIKPNNLSCLSFQSEACSAFRIEAETSICSEQPDYIVALIDNSLIGLDHKTTGRASYIGSYLTLDPRFCSACNFIREFGHFMGLADEFAYLGNAAENQTSQYPNCDHEFSGDENKPCPKWQDIAATGCYPGCVYENWYRPEKGFVLEDGPSDETINVSHSIMRGDLISGQKLSIKKIYFNPVAEKYLREQMEKW
jgi:hypothetical protein